jgi:hypothetical protein
MKSRRKRRMTAQRMMIQRVIVTPVLLPVDLRLNNTSSCGPHEISSHFLSI